MKPFESFEQKSHAEMSRNAVIELMQLFDQNDIEVFVDGGWGVDALLGKQTRSHEDLDIALQRKDVPRDVSALCERFGIALPTEYGRFTN